MVKEERLFFLKCETCGATCTVASIKSGFQAQVGRRAAARARATQNQQKLNRTKKKNTFFPDLHEIL